MGARCRPRQRAGRKLAGDEVAQAIQLGMEYDPEPPFDAGLPDRAPDEIVAAVRTALAASEPRRPPD